MSSRLHVRPLPFSLVLALFALGCESSDVGVPCVPEEEYDPGFSGFALAEVNLESRSFQCQSRVCMVNHFQGRASCPYGQTAPDAQGRAACALPGCGGRVDVPVLPQVVQRRADEAVYCSCRCDGPDPNARYCDCPDGFCCTRLVPDFASESAELSGSYCVRAGSEYERARVLNSSVCDRALANCE